MSEDAKYHWTEGFRFVTETIKSLFLLNGAATVSMLTFIGNSKSYSNSLILAMVFFAVGAHMAPMSFCCAYFTQLQYGNDNYPLAYKWHNATYVVVTSRQVVWLFLEQLRFEFVPVLHRLQGRLAAEG